jgi:hypothetical protein
VEVSETEAVPESAFMSDSPSHALEAVSPVVHVASLVHGKLCCVIGMFMTMARSFGFAGVSDGAVHVVLDPLIYAFAAPSTADDVCAKSTDIHAICRPAVGVVNWYGYTSPATATCL